MIIGACGFGATGSSVVTDYLKEFDNVQVKGNFEFTYVSGINGLVYLERALMNPINRTGDSIYAIEQFKKRVSKYKCKYNAKQKWRHRHNNLINDFYEVLPFCLINMSKQHSNRN